MASCLQMLNTQGRQEPLLRWRGPRAATYNPCTHPPSRSSHTPQPPPSSRSSSACPKLTNRPEPQFQTWTLSDGMTWQFQTWTCRIISECWGQVYGSTPAAD